MEAMLLIAAAAILPVIVLVGFVWSTYNGLVARRNLAKEAWSGIYVQLKRRADLIPNLVETVKGYVKHERETLVQLTEARSAFMKIRQDEIGAITAQTASLAQSLGRIIAVAEAYPDLKASPNFLKLQEELSETEDQIAAARRIYNRNVCDLNTSIEQFPGNLVAGRFRFTAMSFLEVAAPAALEEAPKLSLTQ
jgi:LemA protein